MTGRLSRFMIRKDGGAADNPCGSENHAPNHVYPGRQHRANDLRVRVPATRLEIKPESNVSSLPALAEAIAARHPLSPDSEPGSPANKFDDTEFEESTISTVDGIAQEQLVLHPHRLGQQFGGVDDDPKVEEQEDIEDQEDQDQDYHFDRGNKLHFRDLANVQDNPALYDEIATARRNVSDQVRFFGVQSPTTANVHPHPVEMRPNSPVPPRDRPSSRRRSQQTRDMLPPAKPDNKHTVTPSATATATKTNVFDKTSSYTDSSAERSPHAPNDAQEKRKRPTSELIDYDPQALRNMSFSDLDNQPFDIDPRYPPENTAATAAASTTPTPSEAHLQKLQELKSLSSPDRERFFSSQTKDQWVASTMFFEKRLKELFDELRTARERRRDVGRRFEAEIRERMEAVERSGDEIERSLGEIRAKAKGVLPGRSATAPTQ